MKLTYFFFQKSHLIVSRHLLLLPSAMNRAVAFTAVLLASCISVSSAAIVRGVPVLNTTVPFTLHLIEHASFYLSIPASPALTYIVYSDPWDTGNGFYDNVPIGDVVLITHPHGDHFDLAALKKVAVAGRTLFVAPPDVTETLVTSGGYPRETILTLANWERGTLLGGFLAIEAVPAYNFAPTTYHPEGLWNGYVVTLNGTTRVYLSGDSEDVPEMRQLQNVDVAFVAFNLPNTMDVPEAASAVVEFSPKVVYPYHYRSSNVAEFKRLVELGNQGVEVRQLNWYPAGLTTLEGV